MIHTQLARSINKKKLQQIIYVTEKMETTWQA